MDINELHNRYTALDKEQIVKDQDSINFSDIKDEINKIFQWENDYYNAEDYRRQLPEVNRNSINNEFNTALNQLTEIFNLRGSDISSLAQSRNDRANNIRNMYRIIYDIFAKDYRGWLAENQIDVSRETIETATKEAEERFAEQAKLAEEQLKLKAKEEEKNVSKIGEQQVSSIISSETTEEWVNEYSEYINLDKKIIDKITSLHKKSEKTRKERTGSLKRTKNFFTIIRYICHCFYVSFIKGKVFYEGHSYQNITLRWRFWRSFFYFLLLVIACVYLQHSLEFLQDNKDLAKDSSQILYFGMEKVTFFPIVILVAIGMAFSSKNYKINSNLLEDYKHRYMVAKTVQNILLLPSIKKNSGLQNQFLREATPIIFEYRQSGYMGKNSDEKLLDKLVSSGGSISIKEK